MDLAVFQDLMARTYGERDRARGVEATVAWLVEELGELSRAVRKGKSKGDIRCQNKKRVHRILERLVYSTTFRWWESSSIALFNVCKPSCSRSKARAENHRIPAVSLDRVLEATASGN